jgi:hypothetical protein
MGWVVVVIAVLVVLALVGWWLSKRTGSVAGPAPAARRATDAEVATTDEPKPTPLIPPPGGAGIPAVPLVPSYSAPDPDDTGPVPDGPAESSNPDDEESAGT